MIPTVNQNGNIEFSGFDLDPSAESDTSTPHNRINRSFFRSICIPNKRLRTGLTGKDDGHFIPQKIVSGGLEATSGSFTTSRSIKPEPGMVITPTPSASLVASMACRHRTSVGGKGQFLTVMTKAGLPVPNFYVIEHAMVQAIDNVMIEPQLLAQFHPDGILASQLKPVTLGSLKERIPTMNRINQARWLDALGSVLTSDDFLPQVARLPVADDIRRLYQELVAVNSSQPVIIRSSGLKEDAFGDAQAGKYESCLHSGGDILKSCLAVLASSYQPALCSDGRPQPMALIVQSYLDCRFGGVVLSHTSLQDDTLQIEYAPGQPRGAVAGTHSLKPHRYRVKRNGNNPIEWSRGEVSSYFTLKETAGGFTEEKHQGPSAEKLPEGIPGQLKHHIVQLENLLGCPVDVEFAVDQEERLYLVQVRPITALPGAASFSGSPPDQPLCAGELVSEGLATGDAYRVDQPVDDPSTIPEGAIIHAVNADPWMIEPAIISRAGGFVFKNGGNNDHIAIMLKQSGKPCMRSDAPFTGETPPSRSRVTLMAGHFAQKSAAYLLDGDQTAHWSARYTKPTLDYAAVLTTSAVNKPSAPAFTRVEQGFLWLHEQNQRILNYFLRGRLFDLCLASGHNKSLSMSPHRAQVLQALKAEVKRFLQDTQFMIAGYEHFLWLSGADAQEHQYTIEVEHFLKDISPLKERLATIKNQLQNLANKITDPMITGQELPGQPIDYAQWLNDGETLINELTQLNQPVTVHEVRSAHDVVFYIHKQFIAALEPVAYLSGQGVVEKMDKVTISNFVSDASESLLTKPIEYILNRTDIPCVVINLPAACIANIKLGTHACTVAMFEHGEGGKGRKLRLVLTDNFRSDHKQGKLKRFWYLVHAVQLRLAGKETRNMTTSLNPAIGALTVELQHMESTEAMKEGFLLLTTFLFMIKNLDIIINEINITGDPAMWQWDFPTVEKMIRQSQYDPNTNDHAFKFCLFNQGYCQWFSIHDLPICSLFIQEHQIFLNAAQLLRDYVQSEKWSLQQNKVDAIDQWLLTTCALLPEAEQIKKELAFMLLIYFPSFFQTMHLFIQQEYPKHLTDINLLKRLCCHSPELFASLPLELINSKAFATDVVMTHRKTFPYAGEQIKNDKPTVLAVVQRFPINLYYASSALKEDSDIVLAAVNANGLALRHAGESLKRNYDIVTAAVKCFPMAIREASIDLKQDDKFILALVRQEPKVLVYLEPEYQNREIALAALKGDIKIKRHISRNIMDDPEFMLLAKDYLPKDYFPKDNKQLAI